MDEINNRLKGLSEEERKVALEILKQYEKNGKSDLYNSLKYADYDEIPVDIETFLHNKEYLGNALYDQDGRFTLFPYWEEKLKEIFPDSTTTKYNTIVFTGAIGLGKSTIAVICLLYLLYRLLCLKDPYLYYGLQPIDKISISLMNITLENAKGVALDKMNQMILSSTWFMNHGTMAGVSNLNYQPGKHIELITASSNNQVIGRAIFANFTDECVDGDTLVVTVDGVKKIKEIEGLSTRFVTFNPKTQLLEYSDECTVKETVKSNDYYEIELENGAVLKCTGTHRLMLKDGSYKYVKDLTEDDELADCPGDAIKSNISYDEFIDNIVKRRGQWNIPEGEYFEAHHIVPRCLGGLPKNGSSYKKRHHPNIIWLYPEEHFIAHRLLALEHPDIYGLQAAYTFTSIHGKIEAEDYKKLKEARRVLPSDLAYLVNKYKGTHYKKRKEIKRKTTRDTSKNVAEMSRRKELGIQGNPGASNGMYHKGYKVAGGRNGHANMLYTYNGLIFQCRKDLVNYLKESVDNRVTESVIGRLVRGQSTLRAYIKFKGIFDNLTWRYKDEN